MLVGTFVSFPAEVFRTLYNTLELTARELADPRLREIGAQRLAGLIAAATAVGAASTASRFINGVTAEEDKDIRRFLPEWSQNSSLLYLGRDEDGKIQYIDLSYTDPYSYVRTPLIAFLRGEEWEQALIQSALQATRPFLEEEIFAEKFLDVARNQKKDGGRVYNPEAPAIEQWEDILAHVLEAMVPGTITSAERIYRGITGKETIHGRSYDPKLEALAVVTGHRIVELDVPQALSFKARDHLREIQDAERLLTSVASRRGTVTDDEIREAHAQMERARRRRHEEAYEDVQAAIRLGMTSAEARRVIRTAGWSANDATLVMSGRYVPWRPGKTFLLGPARSVEATDPSEEGRTSARTIVARRRLIHQLAAQAARADRDRRQQTQRLPGAKPEAVARPLRLFKPQEPLTGGGKPTAGPPAAAPVSRLEQITSSPFVRDTLERLAGRPRGGYFGFYGGDREGRTLGLYDPTNDRIGIDTLLSPAETRFAVGHEFGHRLGRREALPTSELIDLVREYTALLRGERPGAVTFGSTTFAEHEASAFADAVLTLAEIQSRPAEAGEILKDAERRRPGVGVMIGWLLSQPLYAEHPLRRPRPAPARGFFEVTG